MGLSMSTLNPFRCRSDQIDSDGPMYEHLYNIVGGDIRNLRSVGDEALKRHAWKLTLNTSVFMVKLCSECSRHMYASSPLRKDADHYEIRLRLCGQCVAVNALVQELFFDSGW